MKTKWKKVFSKNILERGREYYENGAVEIVSNYSDLIEAEVEGSDIYNVSIELRDGEIEGMECDCPYAKSGFLCKHMAATLFAAEQRPDAPTGSWEEALEKLDETEMRTLLKKLAVKDRSIREMIILSVRPGHYDPVHQRRVIKHIIDSYGDGDFSEYDLMSELSEYLKEQISLYDGKISSSDLAGLILMVYDTSMYTAYDYRGDGMSLLTGTCMNALNRVFKSASDDVQDNVMKWLLNFYNMAVHPLEYLVGEFICSLNWSTLTREKLYECFDRDPDDNKLRMRVRLMVKSGADDAAIIDYLEKKSTYNAAFEMLLERYVPSASQKAIELVKKRRDAAKDRSKDKYTDMLIRLSDQLGDAATFGSELMGYIEKNRSFPMDHIRRLKELTDPDEWASETFFRILNLADDAAVRISLYKSEKMYDSILMEFTESNDVDLFKRYEKELAKRFPTQTRDILARLIDQEMQGASKRDDYRAVIGKLKHLRGYPGGDESAQELVDKWQANYFGRRAMMDELRKAGN